MKNLLKALGITIALTTIWVAVRAIRERKKDFILSPKDLAELYKWP